MTNRSVQDFVQRVREKYPDLSPMLIHDNGSAFISRDFKFLVSQLQIQQVFTRRNHPQIKGLPEAIEAVYPRTDVQLCVAHRIRNAARFMSFKDRKAFCADMRPIYTAPTIGAGMLGNDQKND